MVPDLDRGACSSRRRIRHRCGGVGYPVVVRLVTGHFSEQDAGPYKSETRVVGLGEDRMGWFEDEFGEEDLILAFVYLKLI